MKSARSKAVLGWVLAVGVLAVAAPAALSAVAGGYSGKTAQGENVTFRFSGGAVRKFTIVIRDKCPDGHILRITEHYPLMKVRRGRFGGTFVPTGGHRGEQQKLSGRVFRRRITGSLADTSYSHREGALCHGRTGYSARHV